MYYIPLSCTSSPCNLVFLNPGVYGLVQATVGVGTALIWDFCVAYTRGGRGGMTGAHRVLCAHCAKSRLFSTTSSQFFSCVVEHMEPKYIGSNACFWTNVTLRTRDNPIAQLWNGACTLLQVGGFRGYYRDEHCNIWRCARVVRKNAPEVLNHWPTG